MKFLKDLIKKINQRFTECARPRAQKRSPFQRLKNLAWLAWSPFCARDGRTPVCRLAAAACLSLALGTCQALAGATTQSFNPTNNLVNGVNYANLPTNSSGIATGAGIKIENFNTVGLYFDCNVSNNAAAKVWLPLVRSHLNTLTASSVTNNTGTTNWETTPVYGCFISIPAMTNHFTWMTNLPNDFAGCALSVGLGGITNNLASGQLITNLDVGLVERIVPIVYP